MAYLNDYESLLAYTLKLLQDNKKLMGENIKLKLEADELMTMNIQLLTDNEKLKKERHTLLDDSAMLLEFNDELQKSKEKLEGDLFELKGKFEVILSNVVEINELEESL